MMVELELLDDCGVRRINLGRVDQVEGSVLGGDGNLAYLLLNDKVYSNNFSKGMRPIVDKVNSALIDGDLLVTRHELTVQVYNLSPFNRLRTFQLEEPLVGIYPGLLVMTAMRQLVHLPSMVSASSLNRNVSP